MPKVTFSLTGWQEMIKTLNAAGVKVDDKNPDIKDAIYGPASAMIANAQNLAPIARTIEGKAAKKYPPGTLKRSLVATRGPKTQRGIFLVARKRVAPYAPFVELGTSKMSAHPFFRPAFLMMASTYASDLAPGVWAVIAKAVAENRAT